MPQIEFGEGVAGAAVARAVSTDHPLPVTIIAAPAGETNPPAFPSAPTTIDATITRPADTNVYAANDSWSNSTSAPTAGGGTITGAARASGGCGTIVDAVIMSSADPATTLQGEIWVFDQAATNANDNAAFAPALADRLNLVCVIPFTLGSCAGGSGAIGSVAYVNSIYADFKCVGTANLRYLVKVKNAYTPISAEVLTLRLKIQQTN